ncbi:MAG: hypothetical protein K2G99_02735 [Desulfovibrio sp.]|nr:hypothetical protein [Desulfovibrio sp.]
MADSIAAAAYEATPARFRAALKTGLALAHFHFSESATQCEESVFSGRLGFARAADCSPAPWALIVFSPAYAAAARLTAVCAACLLAGVPQVAALCLGGVPQAAALVSLELSGVEDIFQPEATAFGALLDELAARPGAQGRVVILHGDELDAVAQASRERGIPTWVECRPPTLRIEPGAAIDREALAFAHGGRQALDAALATAGPVDALFRAASAPLGPAPNARLTLWPGCEGFWLHPGLDPAFFTVTRQAFAPWAPRAVESPAS